MTVIVIPSTGRNVEHQAMSAIARWGGSDWIVPSGSDIVASKSGLSGAPLNAAEVTSSGLDVTIDTFEAFIQGAWVASDDATAAEHTYTLPGNNTQTHLFLGYDYDATDTFIFGPASEFGSDDPKIPITFVADNGSSVTKIGEQRPIGYTGRPGELIASAYDDGPNVPLTFNTGTLAQTYDVYDIFIYRESHSSTEEYTRLQINGSNASEYSMDYIDAPGGGFVSDVHQQNYFDFLAGTKLDGTAMGGFATQVLRLSCPRQIVENGHHYPTLSTVYNGVGQNVNVLINASFGVDTDAVDQFQFFGGGDATGVIEIRGLGISYFD